MNERYQHRYHRLIRDALLSTRRDRFEPGFADRATKRWLASRRPDTAIGHVVLRQFARLVPLAIAATAVLAVQNLRHRERGQGQSVFEALIGLKPVTVDVIYGLGGGAASQE